MEIVIEKKSGTYADALCAVGYASVLQELCKSPATIENLGPIYRVSCGNGVPMEEWTPPSPGFTYIWRKSKEDRPPPVDAIMDYESEKAIADLSRKPNASQRAQDAVKQAVAEVADIPLATTSPEYRFAAMIESMRKGWASDKTLFRWIAENGEGCLAALRSRFANGAAELGVSWSNSQLLNPSTGKGVHASKTIAKSAGGFGLVEPIDEWMKLRGMWSTMLAFRDGEDFKFYVLEPASISVTKLTSLRIELRDLGMRGGVRLDIEATLRLLQLLMLHCELREEDGIPILGKPPSEIVHGLRLAYFKSLGTAAALMNESLLPLPSWFIVEDEQDVNDYLTICQEPYGASKVEYGPLSVLKEDRSDDVALLQKYRRWLTTSELRDLLEFHASFAVFLMRKISASQFAQPFRAVVLHLLLSKGYPLVKAIIDSPGFQNIARAIRNTTIYAVGMANSNREVRFGLAQKLKQRIKSGNHEFLAALADFVQQQNWEVVHKLGGTGFQVSTSDLDDIVELTERYGAELVGMLLIAYGFARAESVSTKEGKEVSTAQA